MRKINKKSTIAKSILVATVVAAGAFVLVPSVTGQGIGLRKLEEVLVPSKARILRGQKVYKENCVSCHGITGDGSSFAVDKTPKPTDLSKAEFRYGGGPIQIYNLLVKGTENHAAFSKIAYQDLFAVTHYVRSLGNTANLLDSADVIKQAKFEAENGFCNESLKSGITTKMKAKGAAQIEAGKKSYIDNGCAACHGADGKGVIPDARKFVNADEKWVNGSSELGIFDSLSNGVGETMPGFSQVSEDERWAMVHYVRTFIPESAKQTSTPEQVESVCRSLSVAPKPKSISIEDAMKFMVMDAADTREAELSLYGTAMLSKGADKAHGKVVYNQFCSKCHGAEGVGGPAIGPFGATPPYLFLSIAALTPAYTGGTFTDFGLRSSMGVHQTLGEMTPASHLSKKDWQALQTYIAQDFKGEGKWEYATAKSLDYRSTLPSGIAIQAADGGIESQVITFINDTNQVVNKTTWFDFDRLTFNTGSANLDMEKSKSQLENIYQIFVAYPKVAAKLGGYTDNVGNPAKNQTLSQKRADKVMAQLIQMGVAKERLSAEGYGQAHPVCPANDTAECKRQNRRISMRITAK